MRKPGAAVLLIRMATWVCIVSLIVKIRPLPEALNLVSTLPRSRRRRRNRIDMLGNSIDQLLKVNVFCFEPLCWKRAAVLHRYLALDGIDTRIVFGMRKENDGLLHGHSWLEADGVPVLEAQLPNYKVTYVFPSKENCQLELELLRN